MAMPKSVELDQCVSSDNNSNEVEVVWVCSAELYIVQSSMPPVLLSAGNKFKTMRLVLL